MTRVSRRDAVAICGVLALQGDWQAHLEVLTSLGRSAVAVRTAADLDRVDALVLPGGESSTMLRLMKDEDLGPRIRDRIAAGMPALATCAGVILLARSVQPEQHSLQVLDVDAVRNAYGRQVFSSVATVKLQPEMGAPPVMEGVFIRAPRLVHVGPGVTVLGRLGEDPVLVRQGSVVAATFHPELSADRRVHGLLVSEMESAPRV